MRKRQRVLMAPLFFIILTLIVGTSADAGAPAKQRKKSSPGKASSARRGKAASTAAATRKKSSAGSGKTVARRTSRSRGAEPEISQALLRKRGKLTRSERRALASYRSSSRRRGSGRYLARLRVLQARDSALRNIAVTNIEKDET